MINVLNSRFKLPRFIFSRKDWNKWKLYVPVKVRAKSIWNSIFSKVRSSNLTTQVTWLELAKMLCNFPRNSTNWFSAICNRCVWLVFLLGIHHPLLLRDRSFFQTDSDAQVTKGRISRYINSYQVLNTHWCYYQQVQKYLGDRYNIDITGMYNNWLNPVMILRKIVTLKIISCNDADALH